MQKTIKINPELFTVGKTDRDKSKSKNRSIKNKPINSEPKNGKIRQKLLDKIKNYQKNSKIQEQSGISNTFPEVSNFDESLSFLDNLSTNYHSQRNKTFKNRNGEISTTTEVSNQLPDELFEKPSNTKNNDTKSYGCLKNGSLPTFREWKRMTQKNKDGYTGTAPSPSDKNNPNKMRLKINTDNNEYYDNNHVNISEREQRLRDIKAKFREIDEEKKETAKISQNQSNKQSNTQSNTQTNTQKLDNQPVIPAIVPMTNPPISVIQPKQLTGVSNTAVTDIKVTNHTREELNKNIIDTAIKEYISDDKMEPTTQTPKFKSTSSSIKEESENNNIIEEVEVYNIPKILRKTKTLKFKLGRNNKNRKIGIYIKNRETLKNIKKDFNKLKDVDIAQVKKYLRQHNLINTGSTSPNDVLREIYEKAILSGEINNKNTNNLLNNFMNDD